MIRVSKFEVYRINADDPKSVRQRWHKTADFIQEMTNFIWQSWLVWHVQNESAAKIRQYLNALALWRETKQGDKPKLDLFAVSAELQKHLYDGLTATFPEVHSRVLVLLLQIVTKKIKERKAAKGNLSGWMAILLHRESLPSSTRPQPIPYDRQNASVIPPLADGDNYRLRLRVDRIEREGKPALSTIDEVELLTKRRGIAGHAAILQRICAGETKFAGSSLQWSDQRKKWFALVCWDDQQDSPELDAASTAILRPATKHPWTLVLPSGKRWRGGNGRHVGAVRQQLLTQRWNRQAGYRYAGSANKGHGLNRALGPLFKLSLRWKDFVKTCNHHLTIEIVRDCVRENVGTLFYLQPAGEKRDRRFLATAGKIPGRDDSTGWDWHQVAAMLGYKCREAGIKLVVRKCGEPRAVAKKEVAKPPRKQGRSQGGSRGKAGKQVAATA